MAEALVTAAGLAALPSQITPPQPIVMYYDYAAWVRITGKPTTLANSLLWLLYARVSAICPNRVVHSDAGPLIVTVRTVAPAVGGAAPGVNDVAVAIPAGNYPANAQDGVITPGVFAMVKSNFDVATAILFELVAAHQTASLSSRNVNGLLASYKIDAVGAAIGDTIVPHLDYISSLFPRITASATFQGLIPNKLWLKYHCAVASSAELTDVFAAGTNGLIIISAATAQAVVAAKAAKWDMAAQLAIPSLLVGLTSVYLKAVGLYPPNRWYQGEKAEAAMSPNDRKYYEALFKKWSEVKADVTAIGAQNTVAGVVALNAAHGQPAI